MSNIARARELYLIKEYCDAITDPQVGGNVPQLMGDMRTAAAKSANDNLDNSTIGGIKTAVDKTYAMFEDANLAITDKLINQLRSIAGDVMTEATRLMSE